MNFEPRITVQESTIEEMGRQIAGLELSLDAAHEKVGCLEALNTELQSEVAKQTWQCECLKKDNAELLRVLKLARRAMTRTSLMATTVAAIDAAISKSEGRE